MKIQEKEYSFIAGSQAKRALILLVAVGEAGSKPSYAAVGKNRNYPDNPDMTRRD